MARNNTSANANKANASTEKAVSVKAGSKLIAKIALKGDFTLENADDDGLGSRVIEVSEGDVFTTEDAKLAQRLVDQGYAKVKGAKDTGDEPANVEA